MIGQLPQNIALKLWANHVKILGTSPVDLDRAEDRYKFSTALDNCGIDQPAWKELSSVSEAESFADSVGYPGKKIAQFFFVFIILFL